MPTTFDNFVGPNADPIPYPWSLFGKVPGGSLPNGDVVRINNGFSCQDPTHTPSAGLAFRLDDGVYQIKQSAQCTISAIAPPLATVEITQVVVSGGNAIYHYTQLTGTAPFTGMDFVITGCQNAANNLPYAVVTGTGAGTFTVANSSAVNESGSSGLGSASSDCILGVGVLMSADGQNGFFTLIGTNSGEASGAHDSRTYTVEIWAIIAGVSTFIGAQPSTGAYPDSPGDVYKLAVGNDLNTVTLTKNGVFVTSVTMSQYFQFGGYPGIVAQALSNATPGVSNDGTVWTDFIGSDGNTFSIPGWVSRAGDWFGGTSNQVLQTSIWSAASHFGGIGSLAIAGEVVGTGLYVGRSWANDQAASITLHTASGNTSSDVMARCNSTGATCYLAQIIYANGFSSTGTLNLYVFINGTATALGSPVTLPSCAAGDVLRVEAHGTTVNLLYNGVLKITGTDSQIASGVPGFIAGNNTSINAFIADEFITTAPSISGNCGLAGATVNYSGQQSGSVTADASGNYAIPNLTNGAYVITPAGATFTPSSSFQNMSGFASISGVNFAASGNPDDTARPFLGSVSVVGSRPAGSSPYLGHVHVITSPRAGAANPYLGHVFVDGSAPAGVSDPSLGEVVVVSGPPAGFDGDDPYLGEVTEA